MDNALKIPNPSQTIGGLSLPFSVRFWVSLGVVFWHVAVCFVMLMMLKPLPFLPPKPVALQMILVQTPPQDQANQANKDVLKNQDILDESLAKKPKLRLQKKPSHQPSKTVAMQVGANPTLADHQPTKHNAEFTADETKPSERTVLAQEPLNLVEHQARYLGEPSKDAPSPALTAESTKLPSSGVTGQGGQPQDAQAAGLDSSNADKSASGQQAQNPSKTRSEGQTGQSNLAAQQATANQQKTDDWQNQVRLKIEKNLQYPPQALSKKWSGRPVLRIKIDQLGHVLSVDVVKPSGKKVLDMEAVSTVRRIKTLPKPPKELAAVGGVTFSIPVNFNYKDHL